MDYYQDSDDEFDECLSKIPFHEGERELERSYAYETKIGEGAFGYVECGYHKLNHYSVAIKIIPTNMVNDWYYSKMLKKRIPLEVLLLSLTKRINGVVSIIEYYEDSELRKWYIVMMRYTKAVDLFEYITSMVVLSEDVACQILYQLLIIIRDCHLLGVVHRDVKVENILIDPSTKKIWLIDFGSGCLMRDDHHVTYNGTIVYSPPEWLRYQHYRGCQLECWTVGIVLYAMVCGSVPFEDEDQILYEEVRFPRKLSKPCVDLILQCLERDPERRIQPYEIITHPWVTSNLKECDSGRSSFDESFTDAPRSRKCSCSCGENLICLNKEGDQSMSAIETVSYSEDCLQDLGPEWRLKVVPKSSSLDVDRDQYFRNMTKNSSKYRSSSAVDCVSGNLETPLEKLTSRLGGEDNGYNEDIDDNFQLEEEILINSNENFFY